MQISILGSTGSIGQSTLDVMARHSDKYSVYALTGYSRIKLLAEQCLRFNPKFVVVPTPEAVAQLQQQLLTADCGTEILCGEEGLCRVAADEPVDAVMAAIVGAAGLPATMAAVNAGKKVLLANKESLVMAGDLFMSAVRASGAQLLPIDSEHNAIFQCLPRGFDTCEGSGVRKILLSGSGGPFRNTPVEQLADVTPEQACNHPNWSMGKKISVDSATMMNKGLELIEACWLFDVKPEQVDIVVHPQSIVHSLVSYIDGSVLAQLGNPDMRTPIANALAWPERIEAGVEELDLITAPDLVFQAPDFERFPCLLLAVEAARLGMSAPAVLNAANEVAVQAFLEEKISFTDIAHIVGTVLSHFDLITPESIDDVLAIDRQARGYAGELIEKQAEGPGQEVQSS